MSRFQIKLEGEWREFTATENEFLTKAFQSGRDEARFETRGQSYDVNFRRMELLNIRSTNTREIRQILDDAALNEPVTALLARRMKFQVNLGGNWKDFDPRESAFLENAIATGKNEVPFESRGQLYDIDFRRMMQRNKKSGKERSIRQVVTDEPAPPMPAGWPMSSAGAHAPSLDAQTSAYSPALGYAPPTPLGYATPTPPGYAPKLGYAPTPLTSGYIPSASPIGTYPATAPGYGGPPIVPVVYDEYYYHRHHHRHHHHRHLGLGGAVAAGVVGGLVLDAAFGF